MFIKIWKSRRRLKRHSGEHIQTLEPRRLLSASVSLAAGGALTVNGTPGNDVIRITLDATNPRQLDVIVNGATQSFTASSVNSVTVNAGSTSLILKIGEKTLLDAAVVSHGETLIMMAGRLSGLGLSSSVIVWSIGEEVARR